MSLNYKEIELIVSELPLEDSYLQSVIQHDFHSLSWNFFQKGTGRWTLYTEIGTQYSRLHILTGQIKGKTEKLQRFVQFARKNLEGSRITEGHAVHGDRMFVMSLDNHGRVLRMYFRFFSGPKANIIVTDEDDIILDLLYRRPAQNEISGEHFDVPEPREDNPRFTVRERQNCSFNEQIEKEYSTLSTRETLDELLKKTEALRDRVIGEYESLIARQKKTLSSNAGFPTLLQDGELLSSNVHLIHQGMTEVDVDDWYTGKTRTIKLDVRLSPKENIEASYARYHKAKGAYDNAKKEIELLEGQLEEQRLRFERLLRLTGDDRRDMTRLQRAIRDSGRNREQQSADFPGLRIESGHFTLLVGRNAKENDTLLRRYTRGNDWWMHTRDFPGGYVFIKFQKGKSVPLDVLLDAANLAIVFSKAKSSRKADLYYTQVKYLRRAKDSRTGLVLPTNEKNLTVELDDTRLNRLLSNYGR